VLSLHEAPIDSLLREASSRGFVLREVKIHNVGDLGSIPRIPLGSASMLSILSALSARGWDVSDVREAWVRPGSNER
jgi:hypothetical protein